MIRDVRVQIAALGATDFLGSLTTIAVGGLSAMDVITLTPRVYPLEGRTESRPVSFDVLDTADVITGQLADANGRMQWLGRLCRIQTNDDSAGWVSKATGRVSRLYQEKPGKWKIDITDERFIERSFEIFKTTDTAMVFPQYNSDTLKGLPYFQVVNSPNPGAYLVSLAVEDTNTLSGTARLDEFDVRTFPDAMEYLNDHHLLDGSGANAASKLRAVLGYGATLDPDAVISSLSMRLISDREVDIRVTFASSTALPFTGGFPAEFAVFGLRGHEAPVTDITPLHIGVDDASHAYGTAAGSINKYDLLGRLYAEANTATGFRYSQAAIDALKARFGTGLVQFKIRKPAILAEWVEANIYAPDAVPLVNGDGEVAPVSVALPTWLDPETLPTFTEAHLKAPYPTFDHGVKHLVNRLIFEPSGEVITDPDLVAGAPIREKKIGLYGTEFHTYTTVSGKSVVPANTVDPEKLREAITEAVFSRYGGGAFEAPLHFLPSAEAADPGDLVVLDLELYPNPKNNEAGGTRIVQVIELEERLDASRHAIALDVGPYLQPPTEPTVTLAQTVGEENHAFDVTLTGMDANTFGHVEYILAATTPADDDDWVPALDRDDRLGNSDPRTIRGPGGGFASNSDIWVRARSYRMNGIPSTWSDPQSITTAALATPSTFAGTASKTTIRGTWVNTESDYPLMPTLEGTDVLEEPLPAGSTEFDWVGLEAATAYDIGIRYVDTFGGESAEATDTVTTGAAATLPDIPAAIVVQGREASTDPLPPPDEDFGTRVGFEVQWVAHDSADTVFEMSEDSFATAYSFRFGAGVGRAFLSPSVPVGSVWELRARYVADGATDGANFDLGTWYPTFLHRMAPSRSLLLDEAAVVEKQGDPATLFVIAPYVEAVNATIENLNSLSTNTKFAESGGTLVSLLRGGQWGYCRHGVAVTFTTPFDSIPLVLIQPMGDFVGYQGDSAEWDTPASYSATAEQRHVISADDVTESGFTPYLMLHQSQGAVLTEHTADWLSSEDLDTVGEASGFITLANAPAYDDYYEARVHYDVTIDLDTTKFAPGGFVELDIDVEVDIAADGTYEYFQRRTVSVFVDGDVSDSGVLVFPITKTGVLTTSRWRVQLAAIRNTSNGTITALQVRGGYDATAHGITYETESGTPDITTSMTPATSHAMLWVALSGAQANG